MLSIFQTNKKLDMEEDYLEYEDDMDRMLDEELEVKDSNWLTDFLIA